MQNNFNIINGMTLFWLTLVNYGRLSVSRLKSRIQNVRVFLEPPPLTLGTWPQVITNRLFAASLWIY